jgi:23S rRNA pseudouridine2605 synthase
MPPRTPSRRPAAPSRRPQSRPSASRPSAPRAAGPRASGVGRPEGKPSAPPRTAAPRGAAASRPTRGDAPAPKKRRTPAPGDDRPGAIRLQKLLSAAGVASRRTAESLIAEGRVTVNGKVVDTLGAKAVPDVDDVRVDARRVKPAAKPRYIMLNKPSGFVTTRQDPEGRRTVMDLLGGVREYIYPVGRLDYDTEGLLLLTSDGDFAARLTHPRHEVARVYEAIVVGEPGDAAIDELRRGVYLDNRRTAAADVTRGATIKTGKAPTTKLILTLHEGRNRQVREMCARVGHPVRQLQRVRYGSLSLHGLPLGAWRDLRPEEVAALRKSSK